MDLYKSIAWELGLAVERNRAAAFRTIRAEISRLSLEAKQRPVLIVDEAHPLRNDVLEDLRLLTNDQMDSENRWCLLLVGLTELRRRLSMAVQESLAQRIVVRHHLSGLTREEVPEYLIHRLRLAGCELPLFEPPAVEALFQATQGRPRLRQPARPLRAHQRRAHAGPPGQRRACANRPRGGRPMTQPAEPFTRILPNDWTPAQAWAVHEILDDLLEQIEARYGRAVQAWLCGEDPDSDPAPEDAQLDLFDFNDPLPF